MKRYMLALLACCSLAACDPDSDHWQAGSASGKLGVSVDNHVLSLKEALDQQNIDNQVAMSKAKAERDIAKIDAETNVIKAKAQAEINNLIEDSVKDKALLKNWTLGTSGTSWTEVSRAVLAGGGAVTCRTENGVLMC